MGLLKDWTTRWITRLSGQTAGRTPRERVHHVGRKKYPGGCTHG